MAKLPETRNVVELHTPMPGHPEDGIRYMANQPLPKCPKGSCVIRMEYAPINPSDINVLEGTYAIKPPRLPAIPGLEGCGTVLSVPDDGSSINIGDVVVAKNGWNWGSYASHNVMPISELYVLPQDIDKKLAAMLMINFPTAYGLLSTAKKGDWVIQNASNSSMGMAIIQVAKARGIRTINVVRRPGFAEVLQKLGGDYVVEYSGERNGREKEELQKSSQNIKELLSGCKLKLALNAVCGLSGELLAKCLSPGGTILTYGVMSKEPMVVSGGQLLFKEITYRGYHLNMLRREGKWDDMWEFISRITREGKLSCPVIEHIYNLSEIIPEIDSNKTRKSRKAKWKDSSEAK